MYHKPTTNIILNGEKLKAFPQRSGTRQGRPLSPLLFNIVLDSYSNQRRKRNKRNPDQKRRSKALTAGDIILYIGKPKDSIRKVLELISEFSKVAGYKNQCTEITYISIYTNNEKSERAIKESIPFTLTTKRIKYLVINLPKEMKELYTEN